MNFLNFAARYGIDGFLLSLIGVVLAAWIYPYPGTDRSPYHLEAIANGGVSIIFFLYGLKLGLGKLKDGLGNWRLHLFVQLVTFALFPVLGLLLRPLLVAADFQMLWVGIFFLCVLPSTVSSSVVMVNIAGGNLPAAIFNASISSLLGVFLTPLWLGAVFAGPESLISVGDVMTKLSIQVLIPVFLGLTLYPRWGAWATRNAGFTRIFDQTIILLIVYCSFCQSFDDRLFEAMAYSTLVWLTVGMVALFATVFLFTRSIGRLLGFNREDSIVAVFCGSKKSLMQGALMANVMFSGTAYAGIVLLPVMVYHSMQLIIVGIMARRYAKKDS
jgi:sodium/bile acid cotransporter 7